MLTIVTQFAFFVVFFRAEHILTLDDAGSLLQWRIDAERVAGAKVKTKTSIGDFVGLSVGLSNSVKTAASEHASNGGGGKGKRLHASAAAKRGEEAENNKKNNSNSTNKNNNNHNNGNNNSNSGSSGGSGSGSSGGGSGSAGATLVGLSFVADAASYHQIRVIDEENETMSMTKTITKNDDGSKGKGKGKGKNSEPPALLLIARKIGCK
jgi:hypothetical protein